MSIEFVGLPGAGKSTICISLASLLHGGGQSDRITVYPPVDCQPRHSVIVSKIVRGTTFIVRHPGAAFRLTRLVFATRQRSRRQALSKTLNLFAEIRRAQLSRTDVTICEQGVLQALWSVAVGARSPDLAPLLAAAEPYLPKTVVQVEAEHAALHCRLDARCSGRSRFDRIPQDRREQLFELGEILFSKLIEDWKTVRPMHRYVRIENPIGADARALAQSLLPSLHANDAPRTDHGAARGQ